MKAVILAGGYGTRLRPLTFTIPKPMIPLVNKPVIRHIVDYLSSYGLRDIVITTNYFRERIIAYLEGIKGIKFSFPEEPYPLGTAGSVKNANVKERMLIIQGDNITDMNLKEVIDFHRSHHHLATIALLPVKNPSLYGIAEMGEDGRIKRYKEKPTPAETFSNLANTGLYVLEPEVMDYVPEGEFFDFSKNLFPILVEAGEIYGYVVKDCFWTDVGSPKGYMEATRWILERGGYENATSVEMRDVEVSGKVAIGEHAVVKDSFIQGPAVIGKNAKITECKIYGSVVFDNTVLRGTLLNNSIVGENAMISGGEVKDCIIGARCDIKNAAGVSSKIWPRISIRDGVVRGDIKRFMRFIKIGESEGKEGRKDLLRILPEEEAFYFNLKDEANRISYTGLVARGLEEFVEILEKVDQRSIEYHFRKGDFYEWIKEIFGEEELAEEIKEIGIEESGERLREELIKRVRGYLEKL
ncbi:MAG: DUF5752 family protein [Candidatus Methanospirareceae archaeon]